MKPRETQAMPEFGDLSTRLHELQGEAEKLLSTLDRTSSELGGALRAHLEKSPYAVLAAAAGIGYVLGGGLPSPLTRMLVVLGGRIGFELLSRELGNRVVERASNGAPTNDVQPSERNGS